MSPRLPSPIAALAISLAALAGLLAPRRRGGHARRQGRPGRLRGRRRRDLQVQGPPGDPLVAKPRRRGARKRSVQRACLSKLRQSQKRRAAKVESQPDPGPLVVGIDGHYSGWTEEEIQDREALNAPVTRHEWDLENPVSSEEQQMLAAATEIHTRVHALLGGNDTRRRDPLPRLRRRIHPLLGPAGLLGQPPGARRIALRDHLDRARQRALLRRDVRRRLRRHGPAGAGSGRAARSCRSR